MISTVSLAPASKNATQHTGTYSKRGGLVLNVTEANKLKHTLSVGLGSPFKFSTGLDIYDSFAPTPSPLSLGFYVPAYEVSSPLPVFTTAFIDEAYADSESESEYSFEEYDEDAQYLNIPTPTVPYSAPPPPQEPSFPPLSERGGDNDNDNEAVASFSCGALAAIGRSPAELFHEELDRIMPELYMGEEGTSFVVDNAFVHGVESNLYVSPVDVFEDIVMSTLSPSSTTGRHPLAGDACAPDVPADMDMDEIDEYESEEEESKARLPDTTVLSATNISKATTYLLDRRMVAPFEFATPSVRSASKRNTVVPSHPLCGLLRNRF